MERWAIGILQVLLRIIKTQQISILEKKYVKKYEIYSVSCVKENLYCTVFSLLSQSNQPVQNNITTFEVLTVLESTFSCTNKNRAQRSYHEQMYLTVKLRV
jgi:hypothetical protein